MTEWRENQFGVILEMMSNTNFTPPKTYYCHITNELLNTAGDRFQFTVV